MKAVAPAAAVDRIVYVTLALEVASLVAIGVAYLVG